MSVSVCVCVIVIGCVCVCVWARVCVCVCVCGVINLSYFFTSINFMFSIKPYTTASLYTALNVKSLKYVESLKALKAW